MKKIEKMPILKAKLIYSLKDEYALDAKEKEFLSVHATKKIDRDKETTPHIHPDCDTIICSYSTLYCR